MFLWRDCINNMSNCKVVFALKICEDGTNICEKFCGEVNLCAKLSAFDFEVTQKCPERATCFYKIPFALLRQLQ